MKITSEDCSGRIMVALIESNPEILGGKPVIKGTRIPVSLIFELISLNYSIDQILKEYPTLSKEIVLILINLGKDIQVIIQNIDFNSYLNL